MIGLLSALETRNNSESTGEVRRDCSDYQQRGSDGQAVALSCDWREQFDSCPPDSLDGMYTV
jgi:hypothetical protein